MTHSRCYRLYTNGGTRPNLHLMLNLCSIHKSFLYFLQLMQTVNLMMNEYPENEIIETLKYDFAIDMSEYKNNK